MNMFKLFLYGLLGAELGYNGITITEHFGAVLIIICTVIAIEMVPENLNERKD